MFLFSMAAFRNFIKMMKVVSLFFSLFLVSSQIIFCQTPVLFQESIHSSMSEVEKFSIYVDSIHKYLYQDIDVTTLAIDACQTIIDQGANIPDSIYMEYVIKKLYYHYNKVDALGAYKEIVANEYLTLSREVPKDRIRLFAYLRSFTYMSMGDLEAAQKAYYKGIELGKRDKDTLSITNNLFSLGQLFYAEKDFESAIKSYHDVLVYANSYEVPHSSLALTHWELARAYRELKIYGKAQKMLNLALGLAERHKLEFVEPSILYEMALIYLNQNKVDSAEHIQNRMLAMNKSIDELSYSENLYRLQADIFRAKHMYPAALNIYRELISELDSTKMDQLLELNQHAYEVSRQMNNTQSALEYLEVSNEIKERLDSDTKRQKTAYLKVKYDSEQKEIDNATLQAELYKNRLRSNLLYGGLSIAFILLFGLFAALYQKARYSRKLEERVAQRTEKLREANEQLYVTNEELDELNRILSHDLKEPLRTVVGFSELASREIYDISKLQEYLQYINESGHRLNKMIEDVTTYRHLNGQEYKQLTNIDLKRLLNKIIEDTRSNYSDKVIEFTCDVPQNLVSSAESLKQVFTSLFYNAALYNENELVKIDVNYYLKDDNFNFEVTDNGIGIDAKFQIQIFDMFKRLSNRATHSGTGLGLSIAKKLVENLNGEIKVLKSQLNQGTTFLVSIPQNIEF